MSREENNDDQLSKLSKDQQKRTASSIERAHILSVLSKCKILDGADGSFSQQIKNCLTDLDEIEEISLVLQALKFSDHVTICLDPKASNLFRMAKSEALGWYNYDEGELLIGASELSIDRKYFMGVFAHELTHWCMQMVFKNNCLPYFQSDPSRAREDEFEMIVHNVQDLRSKEVLDCVIESVFRDYSERNWHQELIVRVPHLMVQNGVQEATEILGRHQPTGDLLNFYRQHVMTELRKFIAGGDLEKSRETVVKLNGKLGLLQLYRRYEFQFKSRVDINLQENTSLWVFSSPHPYFSFLKIAWTLNCEETTEHFHGNNIFCDYDSFVEHFSKVISIFRKLEVCKTLFIVCPETKSKASYKNLYGYLGDVLAVKPQKRVILTVRNKMLSLTKKHLNEMTSINNKCVLMGKIEFADLLEDCQEMVLYSPITVQGSQVELTDLLEEEERHLCDGVLVERLLRSEKSNDKVIVGDRNLSHRDCPASFVSFYENLSIHKLIDLVHECCKNDNNVFRFSLILVGELENYPDLLENSLCHTLECDDLNEMSITSADELLDRDSKEHLGKPILLFASKNESEYLKLVSVFQESCSFEVCFFVKIISKKVIYSDLMFYPDLFFRRTLETSKASELKRMDDGSDQPIGQDEFMRVILGGTERVSVISDSAGAGKTQFLNLLYNSTAHCWIMKYSLKFCVSFIDEHPLEADMGLEDATSFILKMGEIDDPFAVDLLHVRMTKESQFPFVLLLDGMDEITSSDRNSASKNKEKMANLIRFLKKQTCLRVVIATRPESESDLSHLSCPVYEFTTISLEESEAYLTNLCVARSKLFSESTIPANSAKELVRKYIGGHRLDTHVSQDFLRTPLHVSMLSEIIVESIKDGSFNSNIVDSNGGLIPDKLYSEFINNKYRVYFKEKKHTAVDERLKEHCNSAFEMLAFFSLFGREGVNTKYFSRNNLFRCEESGKVNLNIGKVELYFDIGIISSAQESYVEFVHQTFAEYFVSHLFISWADDESMTERWIADVIYQPHRTLSFFESMFNHTIIPDEVTKCHADLMTSMDIGKTVTAIRYHMWFDRLNILDYIFKCWKHVDQFHIILDPKTYENERDYPLFFASTMSSDRILERVLKEDFDINYKINDTYVISSLFKRGNVPLLKNIVGNGLLKDDVLKNAGSTVVYQAAASGKIDLLEWLQSMGYDIFQEKTLDSAVVHGQLDVVKWLKHSGVNIFHRSEYFERTALHTAVVYRRFHVIKWLVEEGLDINGGDRNGKTPLHFAIKYGLLDMVRFLAENGADVHLRSKTGRNAMHYAASESLTRLDMFKWLVEQGSRVDEPTPRGCSAVHLALKYKGNGQVLEWLLDETKDIRATDAKGRGYVHYAAANSERFSFSVALSKKCDVHMRDETGETAAHVAVNTMSSLEPYDEDTDETREEYKRLMVRPFKLLVTKMMETNQPILEELVSYAKEKAQAKTSLTLESAIEWMETEKSNFIERTIQDLATG